MTSVESIIKGLRTLGPSGQQEILNYLEEGIILSSYAKEVTNEVNENRFSKGKVCTRCGHDQVSRNGWIDLMELP